MADTDSDTVDPTGNEADATTGAADAEGTSGHATPAGASATASSASAASPVSTAGPAARRPSGGWHTYSTRTLLTCAALAAVFTVLFASYSFYESFVLPVAPMVIVFTSGMWFALPLLSMLYVRRVGAGVITAGIGGLLVSFVSVYGWMMLGFALLYAVLVEAVFAVTRWRQFGNGITYAVAVVMWLISLVAYQSAFAATGFPVVVNLVIAVALLAAFAAWAGLTQLLARALRRVAPVAA